MTLLSSNDEFSQDGIISFARLLSILVVNLYKTVLVETSSRSRTVDRKRSANTRATYVVILSIKHHESVWPITWIAYRTCLTRETWFTYYYNFSRVYFFIACARTNTNKFDNTLACFYASKHMQAIRSVGQKLNGIRYQL